MAVFPYLSFSQDYTDPFNQNSTARRYGDMSTVGANPYATEDDEEAERSDSTKVKVRKPLESYFFDDSTRMMPNFVWNIDTYRNRVEMSVVDTMMNHFQIDQPYYRKGVGDAVQGPLGGASIPLNYFDRPNYQNYGFAEAYDTYYFTPENVQFYNVKLPFTRFQYLTAGQKSKAEENFGITHAQNISPSSGFNLDYHSRGTKGVYTWQRMRAKNLSMAFSHTGKKYSVHAGYIYNTIQNRENGGLVDDADLYDPEIELPLNIPVRLTDAKNVIKNNAYYVVQSYGIPLSRLSEDDFSIADKSSLFVGHAFEYSRWTKNYTDTRNAADDYYANWFVDGRSTHDSIFESKLSNRLFVQLQPWDRDGIVGVIDAGAGMDNHSYFQFVPQDFITGLGSNVKKTSYYVYGSVEGKFKRYLDWGGDIKFHPTGYRSGDLTIGADLAISAFIKDEPVTLSGRFYHERRDADYWSTRLFSNHYVWSNSFDKENETRIEAKLSWPSIGLEIGAGQSVINNKVYYDAMASPSQSNESVSVSGLYAQKDFRAGGFHFNHRVLLQWSTSQEIIPVPLASAYVSYYFEFNIVKNVLRAQFGIDGRYNTSYYAPGWNPAQARWYNQRERKLGDYPLVDVFFNAKWKRMRILLKMEHLNQDLFGPQEGFSTLHNPLNQRVFKLGFSWTFYD